jgi:hypothetical protein
MQNFVEFLLQDAWSASRLYNSKVSTIKEAFARLSFFVLGTSREINVDFNFRASMVRSSRACSHLIFYLKTKM